MIFFQLVTKRQEFICSNEELEDKKRGRDEGDYHNPEYFISDIHIELDFEFC